MRRPESWVAAFIESVAERSFGAAFPMFREADPALEHADGPQRRRANATAYLERARPLAAAARGRGDGLRGRALQRARLHGRAHAGRLGPALRGHQPPARGLGGAVGDDRARGARDARARCGALERRPGTSAPAGRAALEPHAHRGRVARRRGRPRRADRADRAARDRGRRPQRGARARRAGPALRRSGAPSRRTAGRRLSGRGSPPTCCRRADGAGRGRSPSAAAACAASARARCRR